VLWCTDLDLRFTLSVGAGLAGLGLRPNQVVGTTLYEFFDTSDPGNDQVAAHLSALAGETVRFEALWGGHEFQARVEPLRDQRGAVVGCIGVAQDITEIRHAQQTYRSLVECIRVVVWRGDPNSLRYTYVAPQIEDLLGYPAARLLEVPTFWVDHLHPDDRDRVVASCRAATREGRTHEMEYRLRAHEGRYVWVRDIVHVVIEDGRAVENVGVLVDISAQKRGDELRRALLDVSHRAQEAKDLASLCAGLHEVVAEHMPARNFYIALPEGPEARLCFPYFRDERDAEPPAGPAGRGLTAWVLRHGRPLLATPEVFRALEARGEVESVGAASLDWLGVPLKNQSQVIGVLAVQSYSQTVRYGPEQQDLLVFISDHVARAIEREQARAALDRTISIQQSILEATADAILVVDRQGHVVSYNQRFMTLWQVPKDLMERGDDDELLASALDQLEAPEQFLARVRGLYSRPLEESVDVLVFKDGRVIMRNSRPQLLDGEPIGRVWSFREVSAAVQDAFKADASARPGDPAAGSAAAPEK
jgi:PAS domain S-box-containing protein